MTLRQLLRSAESVKPTPVIRIGDIVAILAAVLLGLEALSMPVASALPLPVALLIVGLLAASLADSCRQMLADYRRPKPAA